MRLRRLVVHVGAAPSGAVLGPGLLKQRVRLREAGVGVVRIDPGADSLASADAELAAEATRVRRASAVRRPVLVVLAQDLLDVGPEAPGVLERLIAAAGSPRTTVALHTVRQDRQLRFRRLHRLFEVDDAARMPDHLELLAALGAMPDVADVLVQPFESVAVDPALLVHDFLAALRVPLGRVEPLDGLRVPELITAQGSEVARRMRPFLDTDLERARARRFVLENFAATEGQATTAAEQRLLDTLAESNAELFRRHLLGLPADGYADDAGTERLVAAMAARTMPLPTPSPAQVARIAAVRTARRLRRRPVDRLRAHREAQELPWPAWSSTSC